MFCVGLRLLIKRRGNGGLIIAELCKAGGGVIGCCIFLLKSQITYTWVDLIETFNALNSYISNEDRLDEIPYVVMQEKEGR